ncbi:MAG: hypothetical protein GY701_18215 [Sulfitobacter sp.]|nr:hypothetical protein [Sulfitobacter sp.]
MPSDISGSFTVTGSATVSQMQQDALTDVNDKLAASGKGAITDASLIKVTKATNQDGSITVNYQYQLAPPKNTDNDYKDAHDAIGGLANDSDAMTDVYMIMEEFYKISKDLRDVSDKDDKALLKEQVQKLNDSADDIKKGAVWSLVMGCAMGGLGIIGGLAEAGGAMGALKSIGEARTISEGMGAEEEELTVGSQQGSKLSLNEDEEDAPSPRRGKVEMSKLSLNEDEEDAEPVRSRKNAADLTSEESDGTGKAGGKPKDTAKKVALEEEEALEEQDADNKEDKAKKKEEESKLTDAQKTAIRTGMSKGDALMARGRGIAQALQALGGLAKAVGDYENTGYVSDSKVKEAQATTAGGQRDSMEKFKDNNQQAMGAALQALGQIMQDQAQTVGKIWA